MHRRNNVWYYRNKIVIIETNICMKVNVFDSDVIEMYLKSDDWICKMMGRDFPKHVIERLMKNV